MMSTIHKHNPAGRRLALALLAIGLSNCQSDAADPPPGDEDDDDDDQELVALHALKSDLVALVAGDYAEACIKIVDNVTQGPDSGSPLTISKVSGMASWGFGAIDMVRTPSQDFGVVVGEGTVVGRFDLLDPVTQDRLAIVGVQASRGNRAADATVTDDRTRPPVGDACTDTMLPAGIDADVWQIMNRYIAISTTRLDCVELATARQLAWEFSFGADAIVVGPFVTRRGDPRLSEQVQVSEFEPQSGFAYSLVRADHQLLHVFMNADNTLASVQWIAADSMITACTPP